MSRRYYEDKVLKTRFVIYQSISNGVILTKFCENTGTPYGNPEYQYFVSRDDLQENYTEFKFRFATSEAMNRVIASHMPDIVYQFENYGIAEEKARNLKEFYHHSPMSLDIYRDMVKKDEVELSDYTQDTGFDDYYYAEAEVFVPFLHQGLIPILKKMMIELNEAQS